MIKFDGRNFEITRGDYLPLTITATNLDDTPYTFKVDDVLRIKIFEKKNVNNVVLKKDFRVEKEADEVDIELTSTDMKLGDLINKPVDYWYEVELNPDTDYCNTIIAYDKELGAPTITLSPEGGDVID